MDYATGLPAAEFANLLIRLRAEGVEGYPPSMGLRDSLGLDPSGWIADKGYVGKGMITPYKKPPNGELSEAAEEANKSINRIRQVVERTIAHIKAWRIHPHRLPPPPAHIRTDHHRRTRTLRLQNHPLNKLPCTEF